MAKQKKYTGWSVRGRPFSPKEFKKSHVKTSFKIGYGEYLKTYGREYSKGKKL